MATHSSVLAWEIPWTEELCRLQSVRSATTTPILLCYGSVSYSTSVYFQCLVHAVWKLFNVCYYADSTKWQRSSRWDRITQAGWLTQQTWISAYFLLKFFKSIFLHLYFHSLKQGEGNGIPLQYSCLENPMDKEPGGLQSMGLLRVGHGWATSLSLFTFMHWRRKWQPTPVFLPGECHGRGSLVGCHLLGRTESDMTEAT